MSLRFFRTLRLARASLVIRFPLSLRSFPDLIASVAEMVFWDKSGIEKVKLWLVLSQNKSLDEFLKKTDL